jgi:hypothetical protein
MKSGGGGINEYNSEIFQTKVSKQEGKQFSPNLNHSRIFQ